MEIILGVPWCPLVLMGDQSEVLNCQHVSTVAVETQACTMTVFGPDEQMRLRLFMANCTFDSNNIPSR